MTLSLGNDGSRPRKPVRQRSKSDTYMTSPINLSPPAGFSFRVEQPGISPSQTAESLDPRRLDTQSHIPPPISSPGPLNLDASGHTSQTDSSQDSLTATKDSQAGPSARRRSMVGASSPYDPAFSAANVTPGNQISPTGQVFLVPPTSATRRSRSAGGHSGHRVVRSEDLGASSAFTPRTASFLIDTPTSIQVPPLPNMPAPLPSDESRQQSFGGFPPTAMYQQGPSAFFDSFTNISQMPTAATGPNFQYDTHNFAALAQNSYPAYNIPVDAHGNIVPPDAMPEQGTFSNFSNLGWPVGANFGKSSSGGGGGPGQIAYAELEEANGSTQLDSRSLAARGRRRSSVRSDTSGYSGISGAGSEGVTLESKTTEATKQAARRRRKDPNNAKFACDYCGETFTRSVTSQQTCSL